MGRWSANHWKTAVFGWLAFVIAAFVIGNAVGIKYLDDTDANVGEARKGDKILAAGFPKAEDEQGEVILVQSSKLTADGSAFKATVDDVTRTLDKFPQVREARVPYDPDQADQISNDRHSAMVTFSPKGTYDEALHVHRVDPHRGEQDRVPARGLLRRRARQRHHGEGLPGGDQRHAREGGHDRARSPS